MDEHKGLWCTLDENGRHIQQMLASINVMKPEIDVMLEAYRKSILKRHGVVEDEQS